MIPRVKAEGPPRIASTLAQAWDCAGPEPKGVVTITVRVRSCSC